MPDYRVRWDIDIFDAADHQEAARKALEIQRDPGSTAVVFEVRESDSTEWRRIDLSE